MLSTLLSEIIVFYFCLLPYFFCPFFNRLIARIDLPFFEDCMHFAIFFHFDLSVPRGSMFSDSNVLRLAQIKCLLYFEGIVASSLVLRAGRPNGPPVVKQLAKLLVWWADVENGALKWLADLMLHWLEKVLALWHFRWQNRAVMEVLLRLDGANGQLRRWLQLLHVVQRVEHSLVFIFMFRFASVLLRNQLIKAVTICHFPKGLHFRLATRLDLGAV